MNAVLTVLINPLPGRDQAFNDWLTNVHIRDVMRFAGAIRVQRLVAAAHQLTAATHAYLTFYDTFDPALLSREHRDAMGTQRMVVTNAHDRSTLMSGYYYPVAAITNRPALLTPDELPVILEQIDIPQPDCDEFELWYTKTRLPSLVHSGGHVSGCLLRFDPAGQMSLSAPAYSHLAVYRTSSLPDALKAWRNEPDLAQLAGLKRHVSCYRPMEPYLTRDAVERATAEALEVEEAARRRATQSQITIKKLLDQPPQSVHRSTGESS